MLMIFLSSTLRLCDYPSILPWTYPNSMPAARIFLTAQHTSCSTIVQTTTTVNPSLFPPSRRCCQMPDNLNCKQAHLAVMPGIFDHNGISANLKEVESYHGTLSRRKHGAERRFLFPFFVGFMHMTSQPISVCFFSAFLKCRFDVDCVDRRTCRKALA